MTPNNIEFVDRQSLVVSESCPTERVLAAADFIRHNGLPSPLLVHDRPDGKYDLISAPRDLMAVCWLCSHHERVRFQGREIPADRAYRTLPVKVVRRFV